VALTVGLFRRIEHAIGEAFAWIAAKLINGGVWTLTWPIDRNSDRRHAATLVRAAKRQDAKRRRRRRRAIWDSHLGGYA
jgi:hypothetical protein